MEETLEITLTTQQVADRFNELAQQEKWFEIQDELFSNDVKSIEPVTSPYFKNAEGKAAVRTKGEEFVKQVTGVHNLKTSTPLVNGNHFSVGRSTDIDVNGFGRVKIDQIMIYEVKDGQIILEHFFY